MTIWILALVLLGSLGVVGFNMGVIRVGFSLLGLIFGALLAFPLGHLLNPVITIFGVKNPFFIWITGPFIMFVIVLVVFKIAGIFVHKKVDVYYKYKAGDLRMGLWNRMNTRLGLCLGLANGVVYVILISLVVYVFSYATSQMVIGDNGSFTVRSLNAMGKDVDSSGMAKVAAAIDPMPDSYFQAADIIGLIYHNDLLEGRLGRYPAFLSLGERPQFQAIANDQQFTEMRQRQPAFSEIIDNPEAKAILDNPDLLKEIWAMALPNLKDLENYLRTGQSATFDDEKILGRWDIDLNGVMAVVRRSKPNITAAEVARVKRVVRAAFSKMTLVASPDKLIFIKNFGTLKPGPKPTAPPTVEYQNLQGNWSGDAGKYQITIGGKPALEGVVEADKLTITGDALPLRFDKEY
jgi:hypothetical protein